MTWFALHAHRPQLVAQDLRAASYGVFVPEFSLTYWDGRKSVRVTRSQVLLPGYLLVDTSSVSRGVTRHWFEFLLDHTSGAPLRVSEAELLIARCMRGDFDVRTSDASKLSVGDQVLVAVLGLVGEVQSVARKACQVLVAGRLVTVPRAGLALV